MWGQGDTMENRSWLLGLSQARSSCSASDQGIILLDPQPNGQGVELRGKSPVDAGQKVFFAYAFGDA